MIIGRRVKHWARGEGTVIRWEPLGYAMTDTLVQLDGDGLCWFSSNDLKPVDNRGPLPSRREAQQAADREALRSLKAIRDQHVREFNAPWPGAEHGKAIIGNAINGAIDEVGDRIAAAVETLRRK